jgi:O-succinylbenzoic acid--CoA ligase
MAISLSAREILTQRLGDSWLLGQDSLRFWELLHHRIALLQRYAHPVRIFVAEQDPVRFLAGFFAACASEHPVFVGHGGWADREWQAALQLIHPNLIWSDRLWSDRPAVDPSIELSTDTTAIPPRPLDSLASVPAPICIPTGGSSGQLRFGIHTWEGLLASVSGMQAHFGVTAIHSCCVLPLYHVSGLMQAVRSLTTGGTLAIASARTLAHSLPPALDLNQTFLSLVPTQLQRWLETPPGPLPLTQFRAILLGGAPAWSQLLQQARQARLPLALTYGMTETASQVATLHPQAFLAGETHCGRSLPHAQLWIADDQGIPLPPNQVGRIHLRAQSLIQGYYPGTPGSGKSWSDRPFATDDLGYLDPEGNLTVVGRHSEVILTGGEKVHPAEVEAVIRASGQVADVCVLGWPDGEWGEAVTAVYVPRTLSPRKSPVAEANLGRAIAPHLHRHLSSFKHPKRWIMQPALPRNAQGKLDRAALRQWVLGNIAKERGVKNEK